MILDNLIVAYQSQWLFSNYGSWAYALAGFNQARKVPHYPPNLWKGLIRKRLKRVKLKGSQTCVHPSYRGLNIYIYIYIYTFKPGSIFSHHDECEGF